MTSPAYDQLVFAQNPYFFVFWKTEIPIEQLQGKLDARVNSFFRDNDSKYDYPLALRAVSSAVPKDYNPDSVFSYYQADSPAVVPLLKQTKEDYEQAQTNIDRFADQMIVNQWFPNDTAFFLILDFRILRRGQEYVCQSIAHETAIDTLRFFLVPRNYFASSKCVPILSFVNFPTSYHEGYCLSTETKKFECIYSELGWHATKKPSLWPTDWKHSNLENVPAECFASRDPDFSKSYNFIGSYVNKVSIGCEVWPNIGEYDHFTGLKLPSFSLSTKGIQYLHSQIKEPCFLEIGLLVALLEPVEKLIRPDVVFAHIPEYFRLIEYFEKFGNIPKTFKHYFFAPKLVTASILFPNERLLIEDIVHTTKKIKTNPASERNLPKIE